jgi:hypothetical protein
VPQIKAVPEKGDLVARRVLDMSGNWTWELFDAARQPVTTSLGGGTFPSQSEAESWLGEEWRALLNAGVDAVTLREGDVVVYGPMSLQPME